MLKILRKCRLNHYLLNDTKHDPPFFSLDSTFKLHLHECTSVWKYLCNARTSALMYLCMNIPSNKCTSGWRYLCIIVPVHERLSAWIYTSAWKYMCINLPRHEYTSVWTSACTCVHVNERTSAWTYMCMKVPVHWQTCARTYLCMNIPYLCINVPVHKPTYAWTGAIWKFLSIWIVNYVNLPDKECTLAEKRK